jgi:hypothetical protein
MKVIFTKTCIFSDTLQKGHEIKFLSGSIWDVCIFVETPNPYKFAVYLESTSLDGTHVNFTKKSFRRIFKDGGARIIK